MNKILVATGFADIKNIGDYVQSVAQEQFWDTTDGYVDRESLNTVVSNEPINMIMNSWYMFKPENFPPSDCINPFFISIHINPFVADKLLTKETIDYLKKYEPIGARDTGTQKLLEKYGIKSYFSACLTLTLGLKYKQPIKNNKIIFVDPYTIPFGSRIKTGILLLKAFGYLIQNPFKSHKLASKVNYGFTTIQYFSRWLDTHLCMANFYHTYSKVFDDELLLEAEFVTHIVKNKGVSDDEKMEMARNLIRLYAGAKMVVTSRIHAALPCLAVETPVIFVSYENHNLHKESADRFIGLENFFNLIRWKDNSLEIESDSLKKIVGSGKISKEITFENPSDYKTYRDKLIMRCKEFVNKCESREG